MEKEKEDLSERLDTITAQFSQTCDTIRLKDALIQEQNEALQAKEDALAEKDSALKEKDAIISAKEASTTSLQQQIEDIKAKNVTLLQKMEEENRLRIKETEERIGLELLSQHQEELSSMAKRYDKDLESMEERFEEMHVVEFNLLDAELLAIRDERNALRERLDQVENPVANDIVNEQFKLVKEVERERGVLGKLKVETFRNTESDHTEYLE